MMSTPNRADRPTMEHYSRALDEIYWLRGLAAHEAGVLEAHLSLKSFPKSRRAFAEEQVERLQAAAAGDARSAYRDAYDSSLTFRRAEGKRTLTAQDFEGEVDNG